MEIVVNVLPDIPVMVLQLLATLVIFLVFRAKMFGPLKELLEKRAQHVKDEVAKAESERAEASELKEKYEINLNNAKEEAREIVDSAKKRGDQLKDEILTDAKKEADVIAVRAKNDIEREKEKALDSLKTEVASMAMLVANKVVDKSLDDSIQKDMIDKFINEVGESKWQN